MNSFGKILSQGMMGALLLVLLGTCAQPESQAAEKAAAAQPTTQPAQEDTIQRLKLVFIGDIMQHDDQIRSAYHPPAEAYDYEPVFRYIAPLLKEADLAIGNLELTLSNRGRYTGYPLFRTPDVMAGYLKDAGFDILVTSNNHSNDNGLYGVTHTLDILDSVGMIHTGTFRNQQERRNSYPLIVEKEVGNTTFRLALINYTYATNGMPTKKPSVVNLIDTTQMRKDIEKAKAAQPDMIIAFMHWGAEYMLNEGRPQQKLAQWLWKQEVDLVIGAHPHVVQPVKTDTLYEADSTQWRERLVAYSLGNFVSNQFRPNTDIGLAVEVELQKQLKSGETRILKHDWIPTWRYIHHYKRKPVADWVHTILPISAFAADTSNVLNMPANDRKEMLKIYEKTRKRLQKWQSTERVLSIEELYPNGLLPVDSTITPFSKTKKVIQ